MPATGKLAIVAMAAILALLQAAPTASGAGQGGALVVGDSLEELTSPYLERYLPGVPLTINAVGGYNSYQIFDLFQESYDPSHSVIVFDAGTNDNPAYPEILAGNLQQVAAMVGDRCMVVPTIHGLVVDGIGNEGKNRVVAGFAASRPGTQTPDWAGAVAAHPELMQSDNLHPTPEGADLRARLIARGVQACLAGAATVSSGGGGGERRKALRPRPELEPGTKIAKRRAAIVESIANGFLGALAMQTLRQRGPLGTSLALISLRLGCEDWCHA
jgi:hypothetical protein